MKIGGKNYIEKEKDVYKFYFILFLFFFYLFVFALFYRH
jgi:hypothetical protein